MNTQSIDISLYQKGDIALEDIYKPVGGIRLIKKYV